MALNFSTVLLLAVGACFFALGGAALALLSAWVWYTTRLVARLKQRGELYLADWDNEQGRKLRAASDLADAITFMRNTLRTLSPEMAAEFYPPAPVVVAPEPKKKGKAK